MVSTTMTRTRVAAVALTRSPTESSALIDTPHRLSS
jgi:hypothetical protein